MVMRTPARSASRPTMPESPAPGRPPWWHRPRRPVSPSSRAGGWKRCPRTSPPERSGGTAGLPAPGLWCRPGAGFVRLGAQASDRTGLRHREPVAMVATMSVTTMTLRIPDDLAPSIRSAAAEAGMSVNAYVVRAARRAATLDAAQQLAALGLGDDLAGEGDTL